MVGVKKKKNRGAPQEIFFFFKLFFLETLHKDKKNHINSAL